MSGFFSLVAPYKKNDHPQRGYFSQGKAAAIDWKRRLIPRAKTKKGKVIHSILKGKLPDYQSERDNEGGFQQETPILFNDVCSRIINSLYIKTVLLL